MLRTLTISAVAAAGLLLLPGQATITNAAPSIAPKMATPDSAVEQVRRGGGRSFGGGRGFRGGSFRGGRSFAGGRSFRGARFHSGRSFRGARFHSGRSFRGSRGYAYYGGRRHRGWRRGVIIGAGLPFFYGGGYYYGGCNYYYRKWMRTGSRYWRARYYSCVGYW